MKMKQGMKIKQGIKRKLALLLSGVLLMQTVFTGSTAATGEARAGGYTDYQINGIALSETIVSIGNQVGQDNTFNFTIKGGLKDGYLRAAYETFLDNGGYDEFDWKEDRQGYSSYDDYLNAQEEADLPEVSFTVKFQFKAGALDIGNMMSGNITLTDGGEVIGRYEMTEGKADGEIIFKAVFDKKLYFRKGVTFGKSVAASLQDMYKPGASVDSGTSAGDNAFTVTIPEEGLAGVENSDYVIKKTGTSNNDDLTVTFVITAALKDELLNKLLASSSEAAASHASASETKKKKKAAQKASDAEPEEDKVFDPEDDEDWEDEGDGSFNGPGLSLSDIIDKLTPQQTFDYDAATNGSARGLGLETRVISDQIPEGLNILKVESKINSQKDADYSPLEESAYTYDETSRVLTYVIPADSDPNVAVVKRADLRITAQLTEEEYNAYLLSGKAQIWTFSNKALLKAEDNTLLAVSNRVEPALELGAPFEKDGKALDTSNREFKWTVKVKSFFTNSNTQLYAVDCIENVENSHNYILQNADGTLASITISGTDSKTGAPKSEEKAIINLGLLEAQYAYDKVTSIGSIEELIANVTHASADSPLVYTYETDKVAGGKKIMNAIMLIPLSDFKNAPVEIEYITRSTIELDDVSAKELPIDLKNSVKVLWRWPAGEGPGPGEDFGGADVDKTFPVTYSFLKKTAEPYDEDTNTITWNFEVNQFGKKVDYIHITDEFVDAENKLLTPKSAVGESLILKPAVTGGSGRTVMYSATDEGANATQDYYTTKTEAGKTTLIVHLVGLNKDGGDKDYFKYQITTEVTNENLMGSGTKVPVTNTANAEALVDGEPVPVQTTASCNVDNTLIRKQRKAFTSDKGVETGYYDYEKNIVKWNIEINPRGWDIKSPELTDNLPIGTHFAQLTKVSCLDKESKAKTEFTLTPPVAPGDVWGETGPPSGIWLATAGDESKIKIEVKQDAVGKPLKFVFESADGGAAPVSIKDKTFTFEFTTYVNEKHRRESFQSNKAASLLNEAVLTGTIGTNAKAFTAKDEATNTFEPRPMTKGGKYYWHDNYQIDDSKTCDVWGMDWVLYVNRTGTDMSGTTVTDELQSCMELVPRSMKVSAVKLKADGTEDTIVPAEEVYKYDQTKPDDNKWLEYNKFTYPIPDAHAKRTLKFEFTTIMVDDAYVSDMTNNVSIEGNGWKDETGESTAEGTNEFRISEYATAEGVYFAKIYKTSEFESGKFPLKDAEFKIYKMTPPSGSTDIGDVGNWSADSTPVKTRVSNKRGGVSFMFLDEGEMYKIVETKAPAGYITPGETYSWYVVPKELAGRTYPEAVTDKETADGQKYSVIRNNTKDHYVYLPIKNSPITGTGTGTASFIKRGQLGQELPGVKFAIRYPGLKSREVISDLTGLVEFNELDPLPSKDVSYKVSEIPPAGYEGSGRLVCTIKAYTENNAVVTELDTQDFDRETGATGSDVFSFTNTEIVRSGAFTKRDQNGAPLLGATVTFDIERRGDGGLTLHKAAAGNDDGTSDEQRKICVDVDGDSRVAEVDKQKYFEYLPKKTVTSDDQSIIKINELLYGDYKLTETSSNPNILLPLSASDSHAIIYLRVNADGIYASKKPITDSTALGTEDVPLLTEKGDTFSVENKVQYGILQINKAVGESAGNGGLVATPPAGAQAGSIAIPGILFDIYQADASGEKIPVSTPFMTLETNDKGQFTVDAGTGYYTTTDNKQKQLVVGKYVLEEQQDKNDDYIVPGNSYKFTIAPQSSPANPFKAEINYMDQTGSTLSLADTLFLNEPSRGQLKLKKVDGDYPKVNLEEAKFAIYAKNGSDKGDYVADLVQGADDAYLLDNSDINSTYVERNAAGKLYVQADTEGNLHILYGDYFIEETTAPTVSGAPTISYEEPTALFSVTVKALVVEKITNSAGKPDDMKNYVKKHNFTIKKRVETWKANGSEAILDKYVAGIGFEFTLSSDDSNYPGPVNRPDTAEAYKKTVKTDSDGTAKFDDIPIGTYLLKETKVPTKYGEIGTSKDVYVEPMKEIMVVVDENGTTFSYVDNSQLANSPLTEDTSGVKDSVANNGAAGVVLTVRNNYKIGSAAGNKVGIFPAGISGGSEHDLAGATFTLTEKNTKLKLETTSDASGDINFTNVPYGVYTVTETAAPAGYKAIAPFDVTINADQLAVPLKPAGNVREELEDTFILKTIQFLKVDQNGEPLGNGRQPIAFEITRNSGSAPDNLPNGYSLPQTAETDEKGVVKVKLPYGSYTFKEAVNQDSIITGTAPEFTVVIERDSVTTANTKVTIKAVDDAKGTSITQADGTDGGGTYNFAGPTNSFKLKNTVKTGDIRINKQLGEIGANGAIVDAGKPLAGTTFKIYRQVKGTDGAMVPEQSAFITLKTKQDGSFETDADGKYAGKELLVGSTYYLEEDIPADSIYKPLTGAVGLTNGKLEFTVLARENGKVTEFTYNGTTIGKAEVDKTPGSQGKFYNIPKRGTITVNKQDSENNETLSNAEFGIYTDAACTEGNKVAVLKESAAAGEKGRYILDGAGFTKENENGISYVYRPADSKPWKILAGSYWIKETTVPEGYTPPAQPTPVTVKDEVRGTENQGQTITNTLAQVDIKFQKVDQNGDLVKNIAVNGVTDARKISFTLTRLPSSADGQTMTDLDTRAAALINSQQISNDAAGMVEIKNLLKGTYTLTEAANSWITNPPTVYITVDQNQNNTLKVTLSATKDPVADSNRKELSSTAQTTGNPLCDFSQGTEAYKLENQLIYGLVDIKKVAAERDAEGKLEALNTPIAGVIFHIYEDINADGQYLEADDGFDPVLVTVTGTDGRFIFGADSKYADDTGKLQDNRLVYGKTYFLKEYKLSVKDDFNQKYMLDPNYYAFTVKGSEIIYIGTKKLTDIAIPADMGAVTDTTGPDTVFPNGPVSRGGITIKKTDADESLNSKAVTGAEFDVYVNSGEKLKVAEMRDNSDGTYELQPLKGAPPENSAGQAYLKESGGSYELLSGKYYIKEAKAPAGYITPEDKPENYWYFAIAGDGKKLENEDLTTVDGASKKLVTNTLWTRTITVQKMLENLLPDKFHAAGTQATDDSFSFELKAKNGVTANGKEFEPVTKTVEPAGINQGKAIFADIPAGEYTLTEIMTGPAKQDGILSDVYAAPKTISVTVNEKGVFYDGSTANATQITVQNLLKRGSITGKKIAIDSDGKPVNLANAEFTLTPVAPARSGTLTAVSNSKGEFTFQNVPLGEYELRETKTPDSSYEISDKTCRVKVTAENQNVTSDTTAAPIEFVNHASGSFTIEKREQIVRNNDINGVMVPGQGFAFKITGTSPVDGQLQDFFDTANVEGAATVEKKADGIYVTTGITGIITFNHLPVGDYTVREQINDKTSATGPYLPDEKEKTVNITINHATGKVAVSPEAGVKVDNYLKRGQIEGLKTTADKTTPLAGAVIGLFPSTTTAFTEENLWCGQKVTTGEDGKYLFQKVPYGTYLVAELTAPSGYNLNTTTRYEVTVADDKTVKTTGFLLEGEQPKAAAESPILIANAKKSSGGGGGGGGGGGTKPQEPTGPGPGTPTTSPNETSPVNPGESVPGPTNPGETTPDSPLPTLPVETAPGGGNEVIIPPETPPGSDIEIKNPNGDTVYTGKVDENGRVHVELPPGTYTIVTFDENQVPLGSMTFTIEDPFTPLAALAAPDAGDHSVPIVVLAVLMMISLAGMILVARKKKGDKQNPSGKE